jgi:hypothetical protein
MDKSRFTALFQQAVRRAGELAGRWPFTGDPVVEFHGSQSSQNPITLDEALDRLWLSTERFYRVIDVAAFVGEENPPVIFVRPASFEPGPFSKTLAPDDLGPFNVMVGDRRAEL